MATPHINAPEGAFAKTVLMPGDPLRARLVAEKFFDNPQLVTDVRNVYGYTGTYRGVPISVMASGMGMPSIGIYSHELYSFYGVENIIRIGSAGSYSPDLHVHDVVLATAAYSESTYALVRDGVSEHILKPGETINKTIADKAKELDIELCQGLVYSSDVFYRGPQGCNWKQVYNEHGVLCVEMESFALFHNANMLGKQAACLLTISDSLVTGEELSAEERQETFLTMMKLAVESAIALYPLIITI